jgi:hypothetical protein
MLLRWGLGAATAQANEDVGGAVVMAEDHGRADLGWYSWDMSLLD